ncbi:MAG: uroporphyrinogen-III C-methyltransferase [Gammaproteobacteria bacterium]|nr:MAG: uroporphyrinogen-III C-methyltransferase [Gammaproteobacteria bacterium]
MDRLPVFLDLRDRPCLVVGGGAVAARKVRLLRRAGARVRVVAPELQAELEALAAQGAIEHRPRAFRPADLEGCVLAVAATGEEAVNRRVAEEARARGLPVNVVDRPELCSFVFPAIVDRSPVVVAVSSGGRAPVLARMLRERLEALVPAGYGRLAAFAARYRRRVRERLSDARQRRRFWEWVLQGPVAEQFLAGAERRAAARLEEALARGGEGLARGEVYLVGAGPGDPELLSLRALRLLQQADVILYDRLVPEAIVDLGRREAERIYVGKRRAFHSLRQEEINALMVRLAREGKRVLRLKGGDPFVFGRGGEEIATLAEEGIPFQIVPGITAATGCAAYAGIPLTHRDCADAVLFVTGHRAGEEGGFDWEAMVRPGQTLVVYMGLQGLGELCAGLVAHGMPADTPAALVERGTTRDQRVITATVATLPEAVAAREVHPPTLLIVGEVVRLRERLAWYGETAR